MTKTASRDAPLDAKKAASRSGGPSFSLANRLGRVVWMTSWLLLARWTPPPLHGWRALILRLFGARLGGNCRVHASVKIWHPRNLELGDNVLIGPGAIIYNQGCITIGSDCVVSQRAHLCASTHDVSDRDFQLLVRPVTLAPKCWVAAEAFLGPGVTMGEGAVLAARGVLFEDAEAWAIYRGNPAAKLKPRELRAGEA
ncbi:putative colanic acid biosynthesis acetyltransferase [Qipengyuania aquimaris]|uniref:putative colanic acid biosynthesis acetyltransferase n=1 Tax=Qipengyuania aquimaris TaxID=255984 RepID=UPI001FD62C2D|nr:putative colanic acid biosynthesis acetyltransferase [Qipengyuania aquimaris]UOR15736.1 putative colanic acid biosynthesis acetyltransferase [Qipengyuania aquimaris]